MVGASFAAAAVLWRVTADDAPPRWWDANGLVDGVAFLCSVAWIAAAARELTECLAAIGDVLGVTPASLSVTVLAIGNSLGDLAADVALPRLAAGAAVARVLGAVARDVAHLAADVALARLLARRRLRAVAREVAHLVADAARPRLLPRLVHVVDDLHGPHLRGRRRSRAKPPPVARTRSAPPPRGRRRRATALARRRRAQGARWRQNGSFVAAVSPWPRRSTRDSRGARRAFSRPRAATVQLLGARHWLSYPQSAYLAP